MLRIWERPTGPVESRTARVCGIARCPLVRPAG
jgi:hypothetical protein